MYYFVVNDAIRIYYKNTLQIRKTKSKISFEKKQQTDPLSAIGIMYLTNTRNAIFREVITHFLHRECLHCLNVIKNHKDTFLLNDREKH